MYGSPEIGMKVFRCLWGIGAASILFSNSVHGQSIRSEYDEFEKTKTWLLELEVFGTYGSSETLDITVAEVTERDDTTSLFIKASYHGPDWIFIEPGDRMIFLMGKRVLGKVFAETERVEVVAISNEQEVGDGGVISETVLYPIGPDDLARIAFAEEVNFRIEGRRRNIDTLFLRPHLEALQIFVDVIVFGNTSRSALQELQMEN